MNLIRIGNIVFSEDRKSICMDHVPGTIGWTINGLYCPIVYTEDLDKHIYETRQHELTWGE